MQSIAETCVRFDAAHLSINLVSEIAVPMFTTLNPPILGSNTPYKLLCMQHPLLLQRCSLLSLTSTGYCCEGLWKRLASPQ